MRPQGLYEESLREYKTGPELGLKQPGWRASSAEWVKQAEWLVAHAGRLPAILKGQDHPATPAEGIEFAVLFYNQGRRQASALLYTEALTADPKLGDDRRAQHAYNAACTAALAGCGKGKDDPAPTSPPPVPTSAAALDWLRTELAAWGQILDGGNPKQRASVAQALQHWNADSDLAGVRDPDALIKLPGAKRKTWQALWADVDRLILRAGERP